MNRALLVLSSVALLLLLVAVLTTPTSDAAAEGRCPQWEVSHFDPRNAACSPAFEGSLPSLNLGQWCHVPDGAEPIGVTSEGLWAVRRCRR